MERLAVSGAFSRIFIVMALVSGDSLSAGATAHPKCAYARFWHEGHDAFAIVNSLALVVGLALSVNGNMLLDLSETTCTCLGSNRQSLGNAMVIGGTTQHREEFRLTRETSQNIWMRPCRFEVQKRNMKLILPYFAYFDLTFSLAGISLFSIMRLYVHRSGRVVLEKSVHFWI